MHQLLILVLELLPDEVFLLLLQIVPEQNEVQLVLELLPGVLSCFLDRLPDPLNQSQFVHVCLELFKGGNNRVVPLRSEDFKGI